MTPGLVRKEIGTYALAYNLIRTVMTQATAGEGATPRSVSFKATLQVLETFLPLIADRPDRFEPRVTKKGPGGHQSLTRPRREIELQMLERASKIQDLSHQWSIRGSNVVEVA